MSNVKLKKIGLLAGFALVLLSLCLAVLLPVGAEDPDLSNTYYTVNAVSNNQNYGTVLVTGVAPNDNGAYRYGTKVYLTATPVSEFYQFVRWEGDGNTSTSNPLEFTAGNGISGGTTHSYTAIFEPVSYAITIEDDAKLIFANGTQPPSDFKHVYGTATALPTPLDTDGYTFEGWQVESGGKSVTYPKGASLGGNDFSDAIHLTPIFKPKPFSVTIYDVPEAYQDLFDKITNTDEVDISKLLNTSAIRMGSSFGAENVSPVQEGVDYYRMYRGYYFTKAVGDYKPLAEVTANDKINFAIRYFTPKTFKIYYENCERPEGSPEYHTYGGEGSTILTPTREGYTFKGWTILNWNGENYTIAETFTDVKNNLRIGPTDYDNPNWTVETKDDREVSIVLRAEWEVNVYDVDYEGVDSAQAGTLPSERPYDQAFTLPNSMTRTGYTFLGWRVKGNGAEFATEFSVGASTVAGDLVIEAGWQANDYTVSLDPDSADATPGDASVTVTFDQPFPDTIIPPTRDGYTFLGYYSDRNGRGTGYYYFDEDLNELISKPSDISTNDKTLYAYWRINSLSVTVDSALLGVADVTVNGTAYVDGTPLVFDYNTPITVTVTMKGNNKLVSWNGAAIAHARAYTVTTFSLKQDTLLTGTFAQALTAPTFRVDYRDEIIEVGEDGSIPAGNYRLVCGSETVTFTVGADGAITFADSTKAGRLYAEAYFGKTVTLALCGDGVNSADSDAQEIQVAARPAQPSDDLNKGDIDHISHLDDSIKIVMNSVLPYKYEFAISLVQVADRETGLNWTDNPEFASLKGGTPYYIYIRVAASDTYPHGEAYETVRNTLPDGIRQQMIDVLNDLKQLGDGENVEKLITESEKAMKELQPSADFVDRLEEIYRNAQSKITFARVQDQNIERLKKLCDSLKATGAYSEALGIPQLDQCFETAKAAVIAAASESEVLRLVASAETALYAVPISYLFVEDTVKLTSGGMDHEYQLVAVRVQDLTDISAKIKRAVAAGTFMVDSKASMTLAEAEKALPTLDVLGYYELLLMHKNASSVAKPVAPFEIRLLIPEDLRDETGLVVAYRSDAAGLTVLQTTREGNYLIFTADTVENFVILGDHTVNLTGLIIAFSIILLCQIAAVVFLLIRRSRVAKENRAYSLALPVLALTVRFLPTNSAKIVILLGALIVIMQILLLWLLFRTEVIFHGEARRRKRMRASEHFDRGDEAEQSKTPEKEPESVPYFIPPVQEVEEDYGEIEDYSADGGEEEPDFAELPMQETDEETAEAMEEDWYGDDGFIEPAAVPHYSLPDEDWENAEADVDAPAEDEEAFDIEAYSDVEAGSFAYDDGELEAYDDGETVYDGEENDGEEAYSEDYDETVEYGEYSEDGGYDENSEYAEYNEDGVYEEDSEFVDIDVTEEGYAEDDYTEEVYGDDAYADGAYEDYGEATSEDGDVYAEDAEAYGEDVAYAESGEEDCLFYEPPTDSENNTY